MEYNRNGLCRCALEERSSLGEQLYTLGPFPQTEVQLDKRRSREQSSPHDINGAWNQGSDYHRLQKCGNT